MNLYKKLEFDLFITKIKRYSFSKYGKIFIENMGKSDNPYFDYKMIELISNVLKKDLPSNFDLPYIEDILQSLQTNILEGNELLKLKKYFEGIEKIKQFIFSIEDLNLFFSDFMDYSSLIKRISSIISEDGKIKDSASEDLRILRNKIKELKNSIKIKTNHILDKYLPYLQERMITFKNDRIVLPFKASYKNKVNGVVQSVSSSGSTVFIEPQDLIFLNNEMRTLEVKERYEIVKILSSVSHKLRGYLDKIIQDQNLLSFFDSLYARALYLIDEDCIIPNLNKDSTIKILKGRNPLIAKEKVVPLDFELNNENRIVVITGPNTGGKTVVLKTLGLFSVMAQMAIPIPADRANICLFDNIFVDIGDEQAIQQNLSTFSSHMKNVIEAIDNIKGNTLILFDELGAGTDPMEGSALAVAIVDYLLSKNVKAVITTHYNELKIFAYSKRYLQNASMQFDIDTLKPTYKLLMGIPGSSNAFEIVEKMGMKDEIVNKAKQFKGREFEDIDKVIRQIHKEKTSILNEKERLLNTKKELELKMYQYDSIIEKVKKEGIKSLNNDYEQLKEMKKEIEKMVAKAKRSSNLYDLKKTNKQMQTFLEKVKEFKRKEETPTKVPKISLNDWVKIGSLTGKVVAIFSDRAKVDINGVVVESPIFKLEKADVKKPEQILNSSVSYINKAFSARIDLRGYRVEDAIDEIEKFIYDLKMSDYDLGMIVHGKGTGALMKAIHEYLRNNKQIKNFRFGMPTEGGDGVTIIEV